VSVVQHLASHPENFGLAFNWDCQVMLSRCVGLGTYDGSTRAQSWALAL